MIKFSELYKKLNESPLDVHDIDSLKGFKQASKYHTNAILLRDETKRNSTHYMNTL